MADAIPFRADALHPLQAHLYNLLCTRERPWEMRIADRACLLDLAEIPSVPRCVFEVGCGDRVWQMEMGCLDVVRLHPALAQVDAERELPSELVLAILELMAEPVVAAAQQLLELPLEFAGCHFVKETKVTSPLSGAAADFLLRIPLGPTEIRLFGEQVLSVSGSGGADLQETAWLPVPVRLVVPDRESVQLLAEHLGKLRQRSVRQPDLPVMATVEAGRFSLTIQELSDLEEGDILLPPSYPASEGTVILSLGTASWLCTVEGHTATVTSFLTPVSSQELSMSEQNDESSRPEGVAVGDLELPVVFELERRVLTVSDVEALAPGYTFALREEALSPVALTVNGRTVARGRLVDLNGTLGVQLTEVGVVTNEAGGQA